MPVTGDIAASSAWHFCSWLIGVLSLEVNRTLRCRTGQPGNYVLADP